jgi:hypothetical protein
MTEAEWEAVAAEVLEGLREAGTIGYLVLPGERIGPEDNPTVGEGSEAARQVLYSKWNSREIDGSLIKATDLKVLMAAEPGKPDPEVDWTYRQAPGGRSLQIVPPLVRVAPAGTPVLYILNVR